MPSWNIRKFCFLKCKDFWRVFRFLKYKKFSRDGFFIFRSWAEKCMVPFPKIKKSFFLENIRKAFFWENKRIFLTLGLESSISSNIRNFFRGGFFSFLGLAFESALRISKRCYLNSATRIQLTEILYKSRKIKCWFTLLLLIFVLS